jgi:hypothetical protein
MGNSRGARGRFEKSNPPFVISLGETRISRFSEANTLAKVAAVTLGLSEWHFGALYAFFGKSRKLLSANGLRRSYLSDAMAQPLPILSRRIGVR